VNRRPHQAHAGGQSLLPENFILNSVDYIANAEGLLYTVNVMLHKQNDLHTYVSHAGSTRGNRFGLYRLRRQCQQARFGLRGLFYEVIF
jgi:hypothetical protein